MSRWYNYRPFESARSEKVLPQGVLSINPLTGKMKVGDNQTKWKDLPELGGAGSFFKKGPFVVSFDDEGLDAPGIDLFTTEAGDMLYATVFTPVVLFDTGERMIVGTPGSILDGEGPGFSGSVAVSNADYAMPTESTSHLPNFHADSTLALVTSVPTIVRAKTVTGGNTQGSFKITVLGVHGIS